MATQCSAHKQAFHDLGSRAVVGRFDGGEITSDAGGLLLREAAASAAIRSSALTYTHIVLNIGHGDTVLRGQGYGDGLA